MFAYLELIDFGWNTKMSEDECALYIATLYYCGILEHGHHEEASAVLLRIKAIVQFGISKGIFPKEQWDKTSTTIKKAQDTFEIKTTKEKVAGLMASTLDYIIENEGIRNLLNGCLVLNKNFQVSFRGGLPTMRDDNLATVEIKNLQSTEIFNSFLSVGVDSIESELLAPFIDQLVYEVIGKFELQSSEFINLPE